MYILIVDGGQNRARGCYGSWSLMWLESCLAATGCKRRRKRCPEDYVEYLRGPPCSELRCREIERHTFDLPHLVTANEAEWAALCRGLMALQEHDCRGRVVIIGDSRLVLNQFTGQWRVWAENLRPLHAEAIGLLAGLDIEVRCEWRPRHVIAAYLGH